MRLLAGVLRVECGGCNQVWCGNVIGRRMHHHRGMHVAEGAMFQEENLPAPTAMLLCWRSDHLHRESEVVGELFPRPMPAPTALVAMMLWPHAWPIPGRASYSAQIAMRSGPVPIVAMNAVESLPVSFCTSNPAAISDSASQMQLCTSSKATSGLAWIRWLNWISAVRSAATDRCASPFAVVRFGDTLRRAHCKGASLFRHHNAVLDNSVNEIRAEALNHHPVLGDAPYRDVGPLPDLEAAAIGSHDRVRVPR